MQFHILQCRSPFCLQISKSFFLSYSVRYPECDAVHYSLFGHQSGNFGLFFLHEKAAQILFEIMKPKWKTNPWVDKMLKQAHYSSIHQEADFFTHIDDTFL